LKIATTRFGTLEVQEEQIIRVPLGVIGFPACKRYVLLEHKKGSSFLWLQALDNEALAFVLIDPRLFKPDYEFLISPEDREILELPNGSSGAEEVQTLTIVNMIRRGVAGAPSEITANLLGPIVINLQKRVAKQLVLDEHQFSCRYPIPLVKN